MDIAITEAELAVMKVLWEHSPMNARQITDLLSEQKSWHRKTVNTLLSRLEKKGAIEGRSHEDSIRHYAPRIDRESYGRSAATELVDNLFGGDIAPLVACFAKGGRLTDSQIAELQKLLGELSDDSD